MAYLNLKIPKVKIPGTHTRTNTMNKEVAMSLNKEAQYTAKKFSNVARKQNWTGEVFEVDEIIPLSAQSAMVVFKKTTGKKALAHFIHIRQQKRWLYYFIGAAHLLNLDLLTKKYAEIESFNYPKNLYEVSDQGTLL